MPGVTLESVSKRFASDSLAVDELSLEIADGEFMILVGSSGCGKTTALRMIAGLETPTSGTIAIGDRVVNEVSARDRDIAMVFQNYALYPHMTVARNLAYPLRQRRVARAEVNRRVSEVAEMLGLEELLKRRPGQLSGGQRQRVAMGRALVREPEVFLLDEPLSNLDAKLRMQMRAALKRLHARLGVTTVYVTHDQVEAMTLGDRIAVISDGKLQQLGAPQDVYDRPDNVFVAGFIGSPPMNLLRGRVSGGSAVAGDLVVPAPGVRDGDVFVGVRPESLRPAANGMPALDFEVAVVEPLGDEVIVHGFVGAELAGISADEGDAAMVAADGHRAEAVACLPPRDRPAEGSVIQLGVEPEEVHLFDAETGLAIRG
ncbi:MAG TPA: sn-glycerol-3-phosphate ABC transporter ATP-binding protein UgpC [Solirubrobacteraceae bacterium]|jgi:multiple sugar transport system ATP-binding protein|nr:sn-glycerol-3-phosphate ABC transporter ATP-binding protein UgpC [Solirubrobacteraceae bacterium]